MHSWPPPERDDSTRPSRAAPPYPWRRSPFDLQPRERSAQPRQVAVRHSGAPRSIVIGSPSGSGFTTLTGEYNGIDRSPAWSPDGSKIAFSSSQNDIHDDAEIWVMNSDGTNQIRLTSHPTPAYAPTWSPDGSQIAFWSSISGDYEIFIVNAENGSNPINVTNNYSRDRDPSWSR